MGQFHDITYLIAVGISTGSLYSLVALGFVLIYKATGVLNFAQGELMMIGAYIFFVLVVHHHVPLFIAFALTLAVSALMGLGIERILLRRMVGEPTISLVMITIALSILLKSVASMIWGHDTYNAPEFLSSKPVVIFGATVMPIFLLIISSTIILITVFYLFFRYSNIGIAMRAVAEDQFTCKIMGIRVQKIFGITWLVSAVVASIAGILYSNLHYVNTDLGAIGLKSFPAALLGGLDSIIGAIVGGLIIGFVESFIGIALADYLGGGIKEIISFAVLILILIIRPFGLFGTEEIEKV